MEAKRLLEIMREDFDSFESEGIETLKIERLKNYLGFFEEHIDKTSDLPDVASREERERPSEIGLESFKQDQENYRAHGGWVNATNLEVFKSVLMTGQSALKASLIVNGGAALALLAFLGKIWGVGGVSEAAAIGSLSVALKFFCYGVLVASVATGLTYINQVVYGYEPSKVRKGFGVFLNVLVALIVFASYLAFYYGIDRAVAAFNRFV
ncbi:hypothetical protein ACMXYW_16420 [Neptuniibacter sp. QD48_55]|uniref:hypothetical protein n=1 Tax=Neptuniibacter sp. QD48_55 TaxID=3398212 RepID=UPI0039F59911